jgi:hypothetical protein
LPTTRQAGGLADELDPYVDRAEEESFNRAGELLRAQRPGPGPGLFAKVAAWPEHDTPTQLALRVALAILAGLSLLGLSLLGASGSGPLGG